MTVASEYAMELANEEIGVVDVLDDLGGVDDVELLVVERQRNLEVGSMYFKAQLSRGFERQGE